MALRALALLGDQPDLTLVLCLAGPARRARPYAQLTARLITAAGFNIMRQAAPYRAQHRPLPFSRRFDDQFARVARWRLENQEESASPGR